MRQLAHQAPQIFQLPARLARVLLVIILFGMLVLPAYADILEGRVVRVADGDTLTVLDGENNQIRVRLGNIDCPEISKRPQPWGKRAREALAVLVAGEAVRVEHTSTDRYGRVIGLVMSDHVNSRYRNANQQLVAEGHCWVYPQYNSDQELPLLEAQARKNGWGLWGLPPAEHIPPWEWRRE